MLHPLAAAPDWIGELPVSIIALRSSRCFVPFRPRKKKARQNKFHRCKRCGGQVRKRSARCKKCSESQ
jgi:hypothetical protein